MDHDPEDEAGVLRQALAPRRPDRRAFREGVARRIAERERQANERRSRAAAAPERLRWAAGVLPPGLAPATLGAAGLLGKKLGLKAIPGLMALPAMTLLMTLGGFFLGLRVLFQRREVHTAYDSHQEAVVDWWRRNRVPALASLGALLLLGLSGHPETIVAILLASMAVAVLLVAELGKAGLADPATVGRVLGRILWGLVFYGFMLRDVLPGQPAASERMLAMSLLGVGAMGCLLLSGLLTWSRTKAWLWNPIRMNYPDPVTSWCLRLLLWPFALLLVVAGLAFMLLGFLAARPLAVERSDLVRSVEQARPSGKAYALQAELTAIERTLRELESDGGPLPSLEGLRRSFSTVVEVPRRLPGTAASRLGLGPRSAAPSARVVRAIADLRADAPTTPSLPPDVLFELSDQLAEQALPADERRALAEHALARVWPDLGAPYELDDLYALAYLVSRLGQADRLASHRDEAQELLASCWVHTQLAGGGVAGFVPGRGRARPGFWSRGSRWSSPGATQTAIELMGTFGVPASVELALVRGYLADELLLPAWPVARAEHETLSLRLALYQLDRLPGGAHPSTLERWLAHRVSLGALLLSVLCLVAVVRSRRVNV